jgi:predicted HicB family RNase H-like nuclease
MNGAALPAPFMYHFAVYVTSFTTKDTGWQMAKYSDAQKEATARYNKKAYDRIDIIVKKGQRQIIKDFAASQGKSLNRFICDAIEFQMNQSHNDK